MKAKRIIAASLAATMVLGTATSVFADETSANGNSVVENDNSTAPNVKNIVLPTLTPTTYDFVIDRDNLLSQFDGEGKYDGSTVYFNSVAEAARIDAGTADAPIVVYEKVKKAVTAGDMLYTYGTDTALFSGKKVSELPTVATSKSGYYVWIPDTTTNNKVTNTEKNSGAGKWEEITGANVTKYFVFYDADGAEIPSNDSTKAIAGIEVRPDFNYGDDVFDGNVYADDYAAVDPKDLVGKVGFDTNGTTINSVDGLFKFVSDAYTEVQISDLTYVPAVTSYTATSDEAVITNKGTNPIMVDATVTIVNTDGLTFLSGEDTPNEANANVFFSLIGGQNSTAVKEPGTVAITGSTPALNTVKGSATMLVPAANTVINKYQGASSDTVNGTGSHNYYQYLGPEAEYYSASFAITGEVDTTDSPATNKAWADYISDLEAGKVVKPSVQVVYTVNEAEEVVDGDGNVTGYKVYEKATNDSLEALQAAVDVAQDEVSRVQLAYNTAYKNYLDKKKADDAAAADVAEAQQALTVAQKKLKEAVGLGLCMTDDSTPDQITSTTPAENEGSVDPDDPYKKAVTTATAALEAAKVVRLVKGSSSVEVTGSLTAENIDASADSGTYKAFLEAQAAFATAKDTLAAKKEKLTTAQGALNSAKSTADTATNTIIYDNAQPEAAGSGDKPTYKHYWE